MKDVEYLELIDIMDDISNFVDEKQELYDIIEKLSFIDSESELISIVNKHQDIQKYFDGVEKKHYKQYIDRIIDDSTESFANDFARGVASSQAGAHIFPLGVASGLVHGLVGLYLSSFSRIHRILSKHEFNDERSLNKHSNYLPEYSVAMNTIKGAREFLSILNTNPNLIKLDPVQKFGSMASKYGLRLTQKRVGSKLTSIDWEVVGKSIVGANIALLCTGLGGVASGLKFVKQINSLGVVPDPFAVISAILAHMKRVSFIYAGSGVLSLIISDRVKKTIGKRGYTIDNLNTLRSAVLNMISTEIPRSVQQLRKLQEQVKRINVEQLSKEDRSRLRSNLKFIKSIVKLSYGVTANIGRGLCRVR